MGQGSKGWGGTGQGEAGQGGVRWGGLCESDLLHTGEFQITQRTGSQTSPV